jgi:hypothetical protein
MKPAGYSGTPLARKLGIKENYSIKLVNAPEYYFNLFSDFPKQVITTAKRDIDFIHYFSKDKATLAKDIVALRKQLAQDGMIWISWYKKTAKIPTDITEDAIREVAFKNKLVDIKVCAVDELWSGLKLVIPVKDRIKRNQ